MFAVIGLLWCWRDLAPPAPWPILKGMLRFGVPLLPVGLAQFVLAYADRYVLNRFVSLDQVGPYSVGAKVSSFMMLFVAAFQYAWGPFAISIFREANARATYAKVFSLYMFVAGAIGLILTGLAREILSLVATGHYVHGYRMAGFLVFAAVANGAFFVPAASLQIAKRTGVDGGIAVVAAALNVILNLVLVHPLEAYGVASASLIAQCVAVILLMAVAAADLSRALPSRAGRAHLRDGDGPRRRRHLSRPQWTGSGILATLGALLLYVLGTLGLRLLSLQDFVILRNYRAEKARGDARADGLGLAACAVSPASIAQTAARSRSPGSGGWRPPCATGDPTTRATWPSM